MSDIDTHVRVQRRHIFVVEGLILSFSLPNKIKLSLSGQIPYVYCSTESGE